MITKKLKELVRDEAEKLRKFAAPKARARLDFSYLSDDDPRRCIYGQMTGDCFNPYATRLLNQCAIPFSKDLDEHKNGSIAKEKFSKKYRVGFDGYDDGGVVNYFSAIEFYIAQKGAKNKELIAYLKGETDTLKL